MVTKVLVTLASMVAGLIGTKIIGAIWKKVTGEMPPALANPDAQQRETLGKVLTFAVISGASAACIQVVAKRWTQALIEKKQIT